MRQCWPILLVCLVYGLSSLAQSNDSVAQIVHVVDAGETLSAIAVNYGVTVDEIAATNDLNPNAILQIGQRIIIAFNTGVGDQSATPTAQPEDADPRAPASNLVTEEPRAIGGAALDNDLPPAPVAAADAPMVDPAALNALVCVSVYADENQNGLMDPGETTVADGRIRLLDEHGNLLDERQVDSESQPLCLGDGQPQVYIVAAAAPQGYGLTVSQAQRADLRDGRLLRLAFGVKAGFAMQETPGLGLSPTAVPLPDDNEHENLLSELSGFFVLALAGIVLICGLLVSVFLRFR